MTDEPVERKCSYLTMIITRISSWMIEKTVSNRNARGLFGVQDESLVMLTNKEDYFHSISCSFSLH